MIEPVQKICIDNQHKIPADRCTLLQKCYQSIEEFASIFSLQLNNCNENATQLNGTVIN